MGYKNELDAAIADELQVFLSKNTQLLCEGNVLEVEANIKYIDEEREGLGFSDCIMELKRYLLESLVELEEIDALVVMLEQMEMEEILLKLDESRYPILKKVVEKLDWSIWQDFDANPEFVEWMQSIFNKK